MELYHSSLLDRARTNDDFLRVLATTEHSELSLMAIEPGDEIGSEIHSGIDQILLGVAGSGKAVVDGEERPFATGDAVIVPQGSRHNIINTGSEPLRLITVYGPPDHAPDTVYHTKAEAKH